MGSMIIGALSAVASAVGGVILRMLLGVLTNKQFIEDAFLYGAQKLVDHTHSDPTLLNLAKQALDHVDARDNQPPPPPTTPAA
jgi:hypothetical protein